MRTSGSDCARLGLVWKPAASLFQVLHLLAHLLDQNLEVDGRIGHLARDGFGTERIGLAVQFLHQKIEPLAHRWRRARAIGAQAIDFVQVGAEPADFLGDIDFDAKQSDFLANAVLVQAGYSVA